MRRRTFLLGALAAGPLAAAVQRPAESAPMHADPPPIRAQEAAVVDAETGRLLWGQDAFNAVHPASLTKIATALVAVERADVADRVVVDMSEADFDELRRRRSTMMGLTPGAVITLEDLLYGMMLPSGNDAAVAIARYIGGDDRTFMLMVNARIQKLGLRGTRFINPHGLDDDNHLTTAAHLCWLTREAMANPVFARIVRAPSRVVRINSVPVALGNLNGFLGYNGADGVKVGFTRRAGRATVASATRNGQRMIAAVLHSSDPIGDPARLIDWAFALKRAGLPPSTGEDQAPPADPRPLEQIFSELARPVADERRTTDQAPASPGLLPAGGLFNTGLKSINPVGFGGW